MTPAQDATALADELLLFVSRSRQQEIDLELRQRIVERILALTKALRATSQTPDAVKSLELYADSYASMSKMDDGKVEARSVEVDLRQNIIPLVRAALSTPSASASASASAGPQAEAKAYEAARENLREAWAALAMIRETVEMLAPSGSVKGAEYLDGPTFTHKACALVDGIIALAAHPQPQQADTDPQAEAAMVRRIELARAFIAKEFADPAQELNGDWISPEARPAHDALCLCLDALAHPQPQQADGRGAVIEFEYTNWEGRKSLREARPIAVRFGTSEWHPKPQWLMRAFDIDKGEEREFAMADMEFEEDAFAPFTLQQSPATDNK